MKIAKFVKLKNNKYKVSFVDKTEIILYDDIIVKYNLLANKVIDQKQFIKITSENDYLAAYYRSLKYLSLKLRTEKEMTNYLKKDYAIELVTKTIAKLKMDGYLNEQQYLVAYVNDQLNLTANGPFKIINTLLNLGLEEEKVRSYLDRFDVDFWQKRIAKIISKKSKINHGRSAFQLKQKIKNDLFNLGYEPMMVSSQLEELVINDDIKLVYKEGNKVLEKLKKKYSAEQLDYYVRCVLSQKGFELSKINDFIASKKD